MNTPVSFPIAKLLKEKRFDEYCMFIYAPTIAEVVMWLYEKHGIWVYTECDCYGQEWYSKISVASKQNWENLDKRHKIVSAFRKFNSEHKSPTEAYEAAIEYTLNNLI